MSRGYYGSIMIEGVTIPFSEWVMDATWEAIMRSILRVKMSRAAWGKSVALKNLSAVAAWRR